MKYILTKEQITIPDDVTVSAKSREVVVIGPRGKIKKSFKYGSIDIFTQTKENSKIKDNKTRLFVQQWQSSRKQRCQVRSIASQINNMIIGVTKGFRYKMVCAFAHYPIGFWVYEKGQKIDIYNFLGERQRRIITALPGVQFIKNESLKNTITIIGNDVNNVSLTCALIHQSFKVGNRKDIRKFLDGVYVSEKGFDI